MITIDFVNFTPGSALAGGTLIGLSAVILLAFCGRILGISGLVGGLFDNQQASQGHYAWRLAFLAGLLAASAVWRLFAPLPDAEMVADTALTVLAGLLVGFGTRMGSGCTSGHAVCGLARLSPRSMVATGAFMASGFIMASVVLHMVGA